MVLEAGPYLQGEDYMNLEWEAFNQMAWTDTRTTSGSWRVGERLPEPAGLDRQGRRRHHHPLVRCHSALQAA